jgi:hypothetical protein
MQSRVLFPLHEKRRVTIVFYQSKTRLIDRQQLSAVENVG